MCDQSSVDPDLATGSQDNDDGVGDAQIAVFVGEPVILGYCNMVTNLAVAAPERATAFATGMDLTRPENGRTDI